MLNTVERCWSVVVCKLEEEKRRKGVDQKVKEVDKLNRNQGKLSTIRQERDGAAAALMQQLSQVEVTKTDAINPVYKALFQFQQELYKQSAFALNFQLPKMSDTLQPLPSAPYAATYSEQPKGKLDQNQSVSC